MYNETRVRLTQTTGAFINYNERLPCWKEKGEIFVGGWMPRGWIWKIFSTLVRPVRTSDRRARAHIFFLPLLCQPPSPYDVSKDRRKARIPDIPWNRTGRGSFVTKVPFFICRYRKIEREGNRQRTSLMQRAPDVTPSLLIFFLPFSGGMQRCENRDTTNYANARFDAATSISADRNNIYEWFARKILQSKKK